MFVRTKEKVYEVVEENERYYKCCYDDGCITLVAKFDNDVNGFSKALKTADTIADLCDEIVGIDNTYGHQFLRAFPYKCAYYWNGGVYGAIWTDKGLKYIAKMNLKGELELI